MTVSNGSIDPLKYLELYSLNIIFSSCFGREFCSVDDPEFIELIELINTSLGFAGLEHDLPNFLPALSFVDSLTGIQGKMEKFIRGQVNPMVRKFIQEANANDKPTIVRSFKDNGYNFSEEEMNVLMCNIDNMDSLFSFLLNLIFILCS